ncbi:ulvan-active sulfatase-like [Sycon ciliatum]|uniref:ulvan-active sulfatase-like n=1 Tax=Sycon ciliatum TaxID=27933 RepID=UPI0031F62DC8
MPSKERMSTRCSSILSLVLISLICASSVVSVCAANEEKSDEDVKSSNGASAVHPNVLFFGVDDLRPELASYGFDFMHTPSVTRLAERGTQFNNAYCQLAVCSPSRTSLLTGRRPDTTRIWTIGPYFRNTMPDGPKIKTMPQWFKEHGYNTTGIGKIFHPGSSSGGPTKDEGGGDMPYSWSQPYFFCDQFTNDTVQSTAMQHFPNGTGCVQSEECIECFQKAGTWGHPISLAVTDCPDVCYPEGLISNEAVRRLNYYGQLQRQAEEAGTGGQPFFLAVGFKRPHLAFKAPRKYFDLYPNSTIKLAKFKQRPKGVPDVAMYMSGEIRGYPDVHPLLNVSASCETDMPDWKALELRQAYYSSVSLTDAHLGLVLDALDSNGLANNTIIVFWGDHGYQLGEHSEWGKCTNFELGTHVPLLISAPSQKQRNTKSSAMVELVDLFPTLTELAGLPQAPDMEGFSLVPILDDPTQTVKDAAMSQFAREGVCGKKRTPLEESPMGYTIRTAEFRYTEWVKFNYSLADPKPIWSENHGTELYLHTGDAESSMDDFENENLAEDTKYADTVKSLHEKLVTMVENKQ